MPTSTLTAVQLKRNDLLPVVNYNVGVDLTGATVRFLMRDQTGAAKVNAPATIIDDANGDVRYTWVLGDTNTAGPFQAEFEVTFIVDGLGKPRTFPVSSYVSVFISEDIDGVVIPDIPLPTLLDMVNAVVDGLAITNAALAGKQPLDTDLTAIAGLVSAANKFPYFTGAGAAALADLTAAARSLLAAIDVPAQRTALGLGTAATSASTAFDAAGAATTAQAAATAAAVAADAAHLAAVDPHADRAYTDTAITALINAAPGALDTLNELAAALGDDANFAATTATALSTLTTNLATAAANVATNTTNIATNATAITTLDGLAARAFNDRGVATTGMVINKWDMVVYKGHRVVYTSASPTTYAGFISAVNYTSIESLGHVRVADFANTSGVKFAADGLQTSATANTAALQAALNSLNSTGVNAVGGFAELPPGNFYTNDFIEIPNGVCLMGNSTFGSYWSLADDSNCSVVGPHVSTGAGNPNAFYWGLRDISIDCRHSSQGSHAVTDISITAASTTITSTARPFVNGERIAGRGIPPSTTVSGAAGSGPFTATLSAPAEQTRTGDNIYTGVTIGLYGVHCNINPLNTQQSGDWGFDPSGFIFNVVVKNARDAAFANFGRSANVYLRCKASNALNISFIGSFDTRYLSCESDFAGWHGWDLRGSSIQMANCKSYNSGNLTFNNGHGYKLSGFANFGEITIAGCDAQQCTGDGFYLNVCTGVSISGATVAYVGYLSGVTTGVGFRLVNSNKNVISGTVNGIIGTHCLELITASDQNDIRLSHTGALGAAVGTAITAASAVLANFIVINGNVVNAPGITSATSAYPLVYSRIVAAGTSFSPGVTGTAQAAVLNRMELVPLWVPRSGMTVKGMSLRVLSTVATSIARQGIYTSDLTGNDVFQLLGELPATQDTSAIAVVSQDFTTPLVIPANSMIWLATVPQVALPTYSNAFGSWLAGASTTPNLGYAFTVNSVSGALPATCMSVGGTPTSIGIGIASTVKLVG